LNRLALAASLAALLSGCSSLERRGISATPEKPLRVAVQPTEFDVTIRKLKTVQTVPAGGVPDEERAIQEREEIASSDVTLAIGERLSTSGRFQVTQDTSSADLAVRTRLTGYGKVKTSWALLLAGETAVEIGSEAGGAGLLTGNFWVGAGVFAEETIRETLTRGGALFLFNSAFAPVILEGELVRLATGETLWSKTTIVTIDRKTLKTLPEDQRGLREVRLSVTSKKAAYSFADSLLSAVPGKR
jgi:hypothetical protein